MASEPIFQSSVAWNPSPPDTMVICCVDGRYLQQTQEFIAHHLGVGVHADLVAIPGGIEPLTLFDLVPKDFNFLRRRLEPVVHARGTRRIIAIAHDDCLWYRNRKFGPVTIDLRARQRKDLQRAATQLREMFPKVAVETYFAHLDPASRSVSFEAV